MHDYMTWTYSFFQNNKEVIYNNVIINNLLKIYEYLIADGTAIWLFSRGCGDRIVYKMQRMEISVL